MFIQEVCTMAAGSIFTILFALTAGGLLVFGYMHEEKVIEFEDNLARRIGKAIVSMKKSKVAPERSREAVPARRTAHVRRQKAGAGSDSGRAA